MAKESEMINPNSLGHFHRDIIHHEHIDAWYTKVTLSCGHVKEVSRQNYNVYKDHATLCLKCGVDISH
jgi:hypothetical protein